MKDIAGDGGLIKTILTEGSGWTKPKDQDEALGECSLEIIQRCKKEMPHAHQYDLLMGSASQPHCCMSPGHSCHRVACP